jgi:hypothetical protein
MFHHRLSMGDYVVISEEVDLSIQKISYGNRVVYLCRIIKKRKIVDQDSLTFSFDDNQYK